MLSLRRFDAAILLTVSPLSDELISMFSEKVFSVESLSSDDADALLQYYELVEFDSRFIAASLDEPNGRNGRALIGVSNGRDWHIQNHSLCTEKASNLSWKRPCD